MSNLLGTSSYRGFNLSDLAGPVGSIVASGAKALNLFGQNEPMKAAKELVPAAFKNVVQMSDMKAKYGGCGVRDQQDRLMYTMNPSEAAMFAVGVRPAALSQKRQAQEMLRTADQRGQMQRGRELEQLSTGLLKGDMVSVQRYARDLQMHDPTVDPRQVMRAVVERAVDSQFERDALATGGQATEKDREGIARTFERGVVQRQSEVDRELMKERLGMQLGLQQNPRALQRAQMVDALVQAKGMARSEAVRLVGFLD